MITWEQIRQNFERDGVLFTEHEGAVRMLEVELPLSDGSLELHVVYDEQAGVVRFLAPSLPLPRRLPRSRHELRKALLLLNSCFILGGFTETPQGRVTFSITVLIENNELPYAAHRRLISAVQVSVDRALPWLRQVAMGALSAEEAVENVLEISRRIDQGPEPEDVPALRSGRREADPGSITEDEIEEFARSLLLGKIPPPDG